MPWILSITLVLFVPLVLVNLYNARKILHACVILLGLDRAKTRRALVLLLAWLNAFPVAALIAYVVSGREGFGLFSGDNRTVDILIVYPFWISLVVSFQVFLVSVLIDVVGLVALPLLKYSKEASKVLKARSFSVAFVVVLLYSVVTIYTDTRTVRISHHDIALPVEFASLDGLLIAQISDVHGDGRTTEEKLTNYVHKVNDCNADLVLFAGDVVSGGERYIASTTRILGMVRARLGVLAAVGDHDIFSNKKKVLAGLRENGITVLEDSTLALVVRSTPIDITGITYTYPEKPTQSDLRRAISTKDHAYRILLSHQPSPVLVDYAVQSGYNLFVAGHTHGGGVAFGIPGLFLLAPVSFETPYLSGLYRNGSIFVTVTNGLGFTLAPIRFHAPAEITLLRLKR